MTPRDYKLHLTFAQKVQIALPAIMFTVAPLLIFFTMSSFDNGQQHSTHTGPPTFFPFVVWVVAGFYWWQILTLPHTISVTPPDQIDFISLLRRLRITASDVISIGPGKAGFTTGVFTGFTVKHRSGKIGFINQFTGMHELLKEIRMRTPTVELVGC